MWYQLSTFLSYQLKAVKSDASEGSLKQGILDAFSRKNTEPELVKKFQFYKRNLLQNTDTIEVTDFGAGSRVFKSNTRPIKKIAQVAGISDKKVNSLIQICQVQKPQNILEIGTSLGMGTYALSLANSKARITTVEGCPNTAKFAKSQFEKYSTHNIELIVGEFENVLPPLFESSIFDLVYFDGNHSKIATLTYFEWAVKNVQNGTIFIFDDIHWSKEMNAAWKKIQSHPKVKSFITTYEWGVLIF